jgi:hypothetical protein
MQEYNMKKTFILPLLLAYILGCTQNPPSNNNPYSTTTLTNNNPNSTTTTSMQIPYEKYCTSDVDCACGVHKTTGECFYGNSQYVNTEKQCPDYCNGIAAHLKIKCIDNQCTQVNTISCQTTYDQIEQEFENANYCEQDADCKTIQLGGPYIEFSCYKYVNQQTNQTRLLQEIQEYDKKCDRAIDDCAQAPKPQCTNKKCTPAE